MNLFNAIKNFLQGKEDTVIEFDQQQEELAGLNFKTAIDAHLHWKKRLEHIIKDQDSERPEVAIVSADNQCTLGKWIYHKGIYLAEADEILTLKSTHAKFHQEAGKILALTYEGKKQEALILLSSSDYSKLSMQIKKQLLKLYLDMIESK